MIRIKTTWCHFNKLTKILSSSEEENMLIQYNFLGKRIDLHFHDYKLTIEIDENGYNDRNIDYEVKRQKTMEKELGCKFIRIDADKEKVITQN